MRIRRTKSAALAARSETVGLGVERHSGFFPSSVVTRDAVDSHLARSEALSELATRGSLRRARRQ